MCLLTGQNSHDQNREPNHQSQSVEVTLELLVGAEVSAFVAGDVGRERVAMKHLWNQSLRGQQRQGGTKIDPHTQRVELHPSRFKVIFKPVSRGVINALCNDSQFSTQYFSANGPGGHFEASP